MQPCTRYPPLITQPTKTTGKADGGCSGRVRHPKYYTCLWGVFFFFDFDVLAMMKCMVRQGQALQNSVAEDPDASLLAWALPGFLLLLV